MNTIARLAALSTLSFVFGGACRADTVCLTTGDEIEGTVIQENENQVVIKMPSGATRTYRRADVESIVKNSNGAAKPDAKPDNAPKPAAVAEQKAPPPPAPAAPPPAPPAEDRADTKYAGDGKGFTMKYPQRWRKAEGDGGVRFSRADRAAVLTVELTDMPQSFDFQTYFRIELMSNKKLTDYAEIENGSASIAGHNAKKYVFSASQDGTGVTSACYYLFKSKSPSGYRIFKITGSCRADAYDKLKTLFDDMATSFEFE